MHKVDVRVARIFNTYGPRMRLEDGRIISNFIVQALKGEPITVYGDGKQTRSFCFVSDLIEGIIKLMNSDYIGKKKKIMNWFKGPVNLGNPDEYTVLEMAEKIRNLINKNAKIEFKPLPIDDPKQRRPDITKAKKILDWEPKVTLSEGLAITIKDFTERLNKNDD